MHVKIFLPEFLHLAEGCNGYGKTNSGNIGYRVTVICPLKTLTSLTKQFINLTGAVLATGSGGREVVYKIQQIKLLEEASELFVSKN